MTTTLANQLPRINLANGGSMQSAQILTLKSGATGPLPRLTQNRRCTHLSFVLESRASSPDLSRYRTCSYWSSTRPVRVNREFRFAWEKVIYGLVSGTSVSVADFTDSAPGTFVDALSPCRVR